MTDKLNASIWTAFTRKQKLELDDAALVKALGKFDKTTDSQFDARTESLGDVVEQVKKLIAAQVKRKKELGDKVFGEVKDKLYALLDAAEALEKETRKSASAAASDDDEESPALLTTKMIPLLREVRKGDVVMQALIAVAGKETVVMLSRRAISPARGKLLKEQMTNPGGLKFIRGECLFENKSVTFVVQSGAAGLAKKVKAALFAQTDLRLKVRVRGEDPNDIDEEGEDAEDGTADGEASALADARADAIADVPVDPAKARFESRLAELEPRLADALRLGLGDVSRLRAVAAFAREKGESKDYDAALKALDNLERMLSPGAGSEGATVNPAVSFNARLAALVPKIKPAPQEVRAKVSEAGLAARKLDFAAANALLDEAEKMLEGGPSTTAPTDVATDTASKEDALAMWKVERAAAVAALKSVAAKIASARHANSALAIIEIQAVMKNLTAEPSTRQQVTELQNYLASDDVVEDVCELADDIRTPMLQALDRLQAQLAA